MTWQNILKSVKRIPYPQVLSQKPPSSVEPSPNMKEYQNRKYTGGKLEYENPYSRKYLLEPQKRKEVMDQIKELRRQLDEKKKILERYSKQERQATGMFRND